VVHGGIIRIPLLHSLPNFLTMDRHIGRGIDAQAHAAIARVKGADAHYAMAELDHDFFLRFTGQDQHARLLCDGAGDFRIVVYPDRSPLSMSVGRAELQLS
jgi:hypothetical protein